MRKRGAEGPLLQTLSGLCLCEVGLGTKGLEPLSNAPTPGLPEEVVSWFEKSGEQESKCPYQQGSLVVSAGSLVLSHALWHQEVPPAFARPPFLSWKLALFLGSFPLEYFGLYSNQCCPDTSYVPSARAAAGHAEELEELLDRPGRQTRQQMTGQSHMGSKDTEENGEPPKR